MNDATQAKKRRKVETVKQGGALGKRPLIDALEIGESVIFICEPGELPSKFQAAITSQYRNGESLSQQGLVQQKGLIVFEGEPATVVNRVTRIHYPK